jgi:hypothetical protein
MATTKIGVKGSDVYTAEGVGDPRVALSVQLVRGAENTTIEEGLQKILSSDTLGPMDVRLLDAFLMAFQTRDLRGGKGERKIAYDMWNYLLSNPGTKDLTVYMMELLPEYGCWRDLLQFPKAGLNIMLKQMVKDEAALEEAERNGVAPKLSLMAKWAPREGSEFEATKKMAEMLNRSETRLSRQLASYRKRIARLNKALQTVEIKMCAGNWEEIEPAKVPGRCLQKNMRAFLNEKAGTKKGEKVESGQLRHPDDPIRMACRDHFQEHFAKAAKGEAKVHAAQVVYPHELVMRVINGNVSGDEKNGLIAQWNSIVEKAREGGGLGRSLAMCDFSGSMRMGITGSLPYWVSMAMGLLISELTTHEFKDTFLSFDSDPRIHQLPEGDIFKRVESISEDLGQGTSTDFQKAMDLVLQTLKRNRVPIGKEPENLIVLTDMNWDQAAGYGEHSLYTGSLYRHIGKTGNWQTHVEMIREAFKKGGEEIWGPGNGWKMPTIVIWNLSASSSDFHARADTEGVAMLAGWSPSLFKVLQTDGVVNWTPYQALRIQLDDVRYDAVRERFASWQAKRPGQI